MKSFRRKSDYIEYPSGRKLYVPNVRFFHDENIFWEGVRLSICVLCKAENVYPTEWQELHNNKWWVRLRCPDCHVTWDSKYDKEVISAYDTILNARTDDLIESLEELYITNMETDIANFQHALETDNILPEDF